MTSMFKERSCL